MFSYSLVSTSTNFFLKQSELFPLVSGLAILSCSKNILQSFLLNHVNYFTSPLPNNPSTFLLSRDLNELNTCNEINPGLLFYDNLMYPYNLRPL